MARERGRGGDRFGGGRDGDRGGFSRGRSPPRRGGNPPGRKTNYRIIVENLSSRTSWQVKGESVPLDDDIADHISHIPHLTYVIQ